MFGRLQKKKSEMVVKLQEDLQKSPNVAITRVGWTSLNTEFYFTTTVHFVDNDQVLKNAVLGSIKMEKIHTSENIAFQLKKLRQTGLSQNLLLQLTTLEMSRKLMKFSV